MEGTPCFFRLLPKGENAHCDKILQLDIISFPHFLTNNPSDLLLFHGKRALPVIKFVANIKGFVVFDYKNVNFDFVHISSIPVFKSNLGPNQNRLNYWSQTMKHGHFCRPHVPAFDTDDALWTRV